MSKKVKVHEVIIDWSVMDTDDAVYSEILRQIKAPKSHRHSIMALQDSLVVGKLRKTKPPYSFINTNVCLAPVAVHEIMLWVFRVFSQSAITHPGTEMTVDSGQREAFSEPTQDPNDMERDHFISLIASANWPLSTPNSLPASGPARDHELKRLSKIHKKAVSDFLKTTTSPHELHLFVKYYNWDQGFSDMLKVIQHRACDLNTALLVFWSSGVDHYQREYKKRPVQDSHDREAWDLIKKITKNVSDGKYTKSAMPEDFRKEIILVPVDEQEWEINSLMHGRIKRKTGPGKKSASKKKTMARKKVTVKKKVTSRKKGKTKR